MVRIEVSKIPIFNRGNAVSPPSSTSLRYKKNVRILGPHAKSRSSSP